MLDKLATRILSSYCLLETAGDCLCHREFSFIIIIIIVAWSRTVAPLRDLWQPQQTIALTGGFRHLRELDPPRYVEVGLDDDSSSDPVSCLLLCRLPVTVQRLQGLLDRAVRCGRKWIGAGVSGIG